MNKAPIAGDKSHVDFSTPHHLTGESAVKLRRFPFPFQAALAICSDIDETESVDEFLEIQRFLCTKSSTSMGPGVGLEIGNSFYFYDDKNHFSYFTHDERARSVVRELIHTGYIDCLHTYGDKAASRIEIQLALDELYKSDCKLDVWVNHFAARSSLGRKFEYMFGECKGDDPTSSVYHADLTLDYGIRFVWVGATMRVIGQSPTRPSPGWFTVFDRTYPLRSFINVLKEIRKSALGQWGDERYIMQRQGRLMQPLQLADGQQVHEFSRYCNHPAGVELGATSRGLSYAISKRALEYLKAKQGFMIVYTHFGKNSDCRQVIARETQVALRNLEREYRGGEIFVTTTSRLLNYYRASKYLEWRVHQSGNETQIHIDGLDDPVFGKEHPTIEKLQGLTFTVPDSRKTTIFLNGVALTEMQRNPVDHSGAPSVSIPINALTFPY